MAGGLAVTKHPFKHWCCRDPASHVAAFAPPPPLQVRRRRKLWGQVITQGGCRWLPSPLERRRAWGGGKRAGTSTTSLHSCMATAQPPAQLRPGPRPTFITQTGGQVARRWAPAAGGCGPCLHRRAAGPSAALCRISALQPSIAGQRPAPSTAGSLVLTVRRSNLGTQQQRAQHTPGSLVCVELVIWMRNGDPDVCDVSVTAPAASVSAASETWARQLQC